MGPLRLHTPGTDRFGDRQFDYVLLDVPPTLVVADSASFLRTLDGILLLTRSGVCSLDAVNGAREQIERLGARVLGTILNAYDMRTARRSGGYGQYSGQEKNLPNLKLLLR